MSGLTFKQKQELALLELSGTSMKTRNCFPPLHRLLNKLGVPLRPPHYSSFMNIVAGVTVSFGFIWGWLMHMTLWAGPGSTLLAALSKSLLIGLFLGLFLACFYRHGIIKHQLTPWDKLAMLEDSH